MLIIIDDNTLYHCGTLFKELGKKCSAISRIENKELFNGLKTKLFGVNNK